MRRMDIGIRSFAARHDFFEFFVYLPLPKVRHRDQRGIAFAVDHHHVRPGRHKAQAAGFQQLHHVVHLQTLLAAAEPPDVGVITPNRPPQGRHTLFSQGAKQSLLILCRERA